MWLHGPISPDLCSHQPPVSEAFYKLSGDDCVRNLSFRMISSSCTPVQCWHAFVNHPQVSVGKLLGFLRVLAVQP
jgi:hypothetical protein